jgi:hypothetical protein
MLIEIVLLKKCFNYSDNIFKTVGVLTGSNDNLTMRTVLSFMHYRFYLKSPNLRGLDYGAE